MGWMSKLRARRRRDRTLAIAKEVIKAVNVAGVVFMSEDQFFDIEHVREVIVLLSTLEDKMTIRANVFQSQVVFHAEDVWNHY